jgi:heme/copper-type cytochrome/quinol oxidase subunit 2
VTLSPRIVDALFWLGVACCVVAQVFIVRAALKPSRADVQEGVPVPRRASEVAWTIIPGIVLAIVLVWTWRAIHASRTSPPRPVDGSQFTASSDRRPRTVNPQL